MLNAQRERIIAAWRLAEQKYLKERIVVADLALLEDAPESIREAADRVLAAVEEETNNCIALLFEDWHEASEEIRAQLRLVVTPDRSHRGIAV